MIKNKEGFTLVELLAMLVVLGILMLVTIPNITGILNQSKDNQVIDDATKMIETAKIKIVTHTTGYDKIPKISNGECVVLSLNYLNDNEDIGKGPNEGEYQEYDSYVVYKLEGNQRKYYVRLVEDIKGKYQGIDEVSSEELEKNPHNSIQKITGLKGFTASSDLNTIKNTIKTSCSSIKFYK